MVRRSLSIIAALLLSACSPQIVKVEVYKKMPPPAELSTWVPKPMPVWVPVTDPKATSALTAEGEKRLRNLVHDMKTRIRAWEAWANQKVEER